MVENTSGIVSTASSRPNGSIGRPSACATGTFVAMKLTCPGNPTEPMLTTTVSGTTASMCQVEISIPEAQAMNALATTYCTGLVMRNSEAAIGSTSELVSSR